MKKTFFIVAAAMFLTVNAYAQMFGPISKWRQAGDTLKNRSGYIVQLATATDTVYIGAGGIWSSSMDSACTWSKLDSLLSLYIAISPFALDTTGVPVNYVMKRSTTGWTTGPLSTSSGGAFSSVDSGTTQLYFDSLDASILQIQEDHDSTVITSGSNARFVFHNLVKIDTLVTDSIATSYISVATLAVLSGLDMSGNEIEHVAWPTDDSSAVNWGFLKQLFSGNTETKITVTVQGDSTVDFVVSGINVSDSLNLGGQWKINGDSLVAYNAAGNDSLVFDIANHAILGGDGPVTVDSIVVTTDGYVRIAGAKIADFAGYGLRVQGGDTLALAVDTSLIATKQFVRDSSSGEGSGSGWVEVDDTTYAQLNASGDTIAVLIDSSGTTIFRPPLDGSLYVGGESGDVTIDSGLVLPVNGFISIGVGTLIMDSAFFDSAFTGKGRFSGSSGGVSEATLNDTASDIRADIADSVAVSTAASANAVASESGNDVTITATGNGDDIIVKGGGDGTIQIEEPSGTLQWTFQSNRMTGEEGTAIAVDSLRSVYEAAIDTIRGLNKLTSDKGVISDTSINWPEEWVIPTLAGGASAPSDSIAAYSGRYVNGQFWQVLNTTTGAIDAGARDTLYFLAKFPPNAVIDSVHMRVANTGDSAIVNLDVLGPDMSNGDFVLLDSTYQSWSLNSTGATGTWAAPFAYTWELSNSITAGPTSAYGLRVITDFQATGDSIAFTFQIGYRRK